MFAVENVVANKGHRVTDRNLEKPPLNSVKFGREPSDAAELENNGIRNDKDCVLAGFMDAAQMIKMGKTTFANGISKMN